MEDEYSGTRIVWGPPGTGKTRFLSRQANKIVNSLDWRERDVSPVAICSLTKAAATEIASRHLSIPEWQVGTLHSLAYRQMPLKPVAEVEIADWNEKHGDMPVKIDKVDHDDLGIDPSSANLEYGTKLYQEYSLLRAKVVPRKAWGVTVSRFASLWEKWKQDQDLFDFTDMVDVDTEGIPPAAPGAPKVILVDEAQDTSALEWRLIRKWAERAGGLIVAGDPWQCLYRWRGADASIFFDESIPEDRKKILAQSYRVPQKVKDLSMQWVRQNLRGFREIDYRPRSGDLGAVNVSEVKYKYVDRLLKSILGCLEYGESTMICATCGYMLADIVSLLRREGIPFSNPWRKKRGDWNPLQASRGTPTWQKLLYFTRLARGGKPFTYKEANDMLSLLKVRGVLRSGAKQFYKEFSGLRPNTEVRKGELEAAFAEEAWHTLEPILSSDSPKRTEGLLVWLGDRCLGLQQKKLHYLGGVMQRFGEDGFLDAPKVYVGTIHSFKGAEADNVILFPDLSSSGARQYNSSDPEEVNDVVRAFYVGLTRARKSVTICSPVSTLSVDMKLVLGTF